MNDLEGKTIKNYRVVKRLGAGGMGTVFLAEVVKAKKGLRVGVEVALKILHPHLAADEDILRRFKREAGVGLAIKHENVVATYDVGSEKVGGETLHFIVMEYLRGRTLSKVLDDDGRMSESRAFHVYRQGVAALAALHEHDILHRDIKPGNLFLDAEDHLHIVDLGLSRLVEPGTEISLPGTFVGSAAYSSPEQIASGPIGKATDLYSLGVTAYECLTGFNPFHGPDLPSTMANQTRLVPRPVSAFAPDVSYFFERVVAQALEKDPARRLQPASRLLRILEEREESDWWKAYVEGEAMEAHLSRSRRRLRVRRATRVYGRDAARGALVDALRTAAVARSGRVVVVTGETGIGKSRLIDSALESEEIEPLGAQVLVSRFLDQAAATPYYALNEALLMALGVDAVPRADRTRVLAEKLRENLPERRVFADAFASLVLGEGGAGVASGGTNAPGASALAGSSAAKQLPPEAVPALYAEVLRTLSVRSPIFLVIEEIQWADRGSLRALLALASTLAVFPIAIVLTARESALAETMPGEPPSAPFFKKLFELKEALHVTLERLDDTAVRSVLRDVGVPPALLKSLGKRLHEASEGNPGFLFALIDDLERRGKLRSIKPAELKRLPLPKSVLDLLARRLEDIDAEAKRFLEFASVFGARFKPEPVIEGLGLDLLKASEVLSRLTQRYHLVRSFDDAYRFDHHLLRERVYLGIDPALRREYHLTVAQIHARSSTDPHAATRANYEAGIHFSFAEAHSRAARYLIGAVDFCEDRNLHERAQRLADKALDHLSQVSDDDATIVASDRVALFLGAASVYGHLGQRARQGELLRSAARVALTANDDRRIAQVEVELAAYDSSTGRVFAALQHCERSREAARRAGDLALEARSLRVEAAVLETLGQTDYDDELKRADELAAAAGDELGRAYGFLIFGQLYLATDRLELALETQKQALALFERLEDQRGRGRAFFQLARTYRELGDLERAEKSADAALTIAEANSDQALKARALYVSGELAMRARRHAEARARLERALDLFKMTSDAPFEVYTHVALALLFIANQNPERDPAVAATYAASGVAIAQKYELARQEAYAYAALAVAYLAQGKSKFALAVSKKGMKFLETHQAARKRQAELSFIHYRCLKAIDREDEAREFLVRARDLVLERSTGIEDAQRREAFLTSDLFNAAVVREADRVLRS